ncbi:g8495 [Coccomyxa viridis]|uniref:G8495 protein n=1 Tax=Coccomyxa viridis TaxID=1274662 RepID=A0ABP1G0I0_9CHLO
MGYAGYVPARYAPAAPTAVQAALYAVQSQAALELIAKLTKNVVISPTEEKFKRVKLSNPKIKAALVDTPGAIDALLAIGWLREQEPEEAMVVPKGRHFTMAEVRMVDDAAERLRKRQRDEARASSAQQRTAASSAAAQVRAQMEADRRERAARAADVRA